MLILGIKSNAKLWGGERLHDYGADKTMTGIGQSFSMSATKEFDCDIVGGEYKGETLRKVYHDHYERFGYDKYNKDTFPLMVDLVDAVNGDLSIQVHPIDSYAQEHMNMPFGKTESWFYMIPPETGEIYCGCKVDTIEEVKQKIQEEKWDELVDKIKVPKESYVYIEAGCLHAIAKGSLLYEIQQSNDTTYRFYDFDRLDKDGKKRPLQLKEAVANINPSLDSKAESFDFDEVKEEYCYKLQRKQLKDSWTNEDAYFAGVTLLQGEIDINGEKAAQGTTVIVFPGETITFTGEAQAIIAWPR